MEGGGKELVVMGGVIQTPPMTVEARRETGYLLRLLQEGELIGMPKSRPMPTIASACHELRIREENTTWRCICFVDSDAIVVLEVFAKKTNQDTQVGDQCLQAEATDLPQRTKEDWGMKPSTRKRLEAAGAQVTTVQGFLGLSDADMAIIEMKIALAKLLRECRKSADLTQEQAAKLFGSSQSRVAKMEAGDPAVSLDLLVVSLLKLGASPQVVGKRLERVDFAGRPQVAKVPRRSGPVSQRPGRKAAGQGLRRTKKSA